MKKSCLALLLLVATGSLDCAAEPSIDKAFNRMYNFDFDGMHSILDDCGCKNPGDPMTYAARAVAYLFSELHRLRILETEFFTDDDQVTDKNKLKPDLVVRAKLFQMTQEARKRASAILAKDPENRNAMSAICTAAEVETDYTILVEKKYLRSFSMSKESQKYARKLLAMDPPVVDAHLTLGMVEYVVSNLNWFYRLFVRFNRIEGSKDKAIENLKAVVKGGRYYAPLAKILLSVIYLREKMPQQALNLMREMERDFPENPLIQSEVKKIAQKVALLPQ
ncbi:MAG: hypothetical protein QUT30_00255 [Acidobacteriota bacterium]|nr:hypothetical protein [Acidobacteriota bacterium]